MGLISVTETTPTRALVFVSALNFARFFAFFTGFAEILIFPLTELLQFGFFYTTSAAAIQGEASPRDALNSAAACLS